MGSEGIIGTLAFVTIGLVISLSVVHFGLSLRDPKNTRAAGNVLHGATAASTQAGIELPGDTTLKERLDASAASRHP